MKLRWFWLFSIEMALICMAVLTVGGQNDSGEKNKQVSVEKAPPPFSSGRYALHGQQWAVVKTSSYIVFGIPSDAGGFSRYERARLIAEERLDPLSGKVKMGDRNDYLIKKMGGEAAICLKNPQHALGLPDPTLIVTIDSNFEQALKRNRWDIAYYWRDMLIGPNMSRVVPSTRRGRVRHHLRFRRHPRPRSFNDEDSWHMIPEGYSRGKL